MVWFESFPLWFESFANYTRTPAEQCGARFRARTGGGNSVVQAQAQAQPVRTSSVLSSCSVRATCVSALGMVIIE